LSDYYFEFFVGRQERHLSENPVSAIPKDSPFEAFGWPNLE